MSHAIIEINDSGVAVARDGRLVARSPGIAVVRQNGIELGESAARLAHVDPRNTFNRFWVDLSQDELPGVRGQIRHHADLAFAHLKSLHEQAGRPERIVFAVPASFTTEQLSLLLGLGQAGRMEVVGLVDAAVAAAAVSAPPGMSRHVDLHLHHAVITDIEVTDHAERAGYSVIHGVGVLAVYDRLASVIADQFVQQARLDPLRHAVTEQALYDQLPVCLRDLQSRPEVVLEIRFENVRYQARVHREQLVRGLDPVYARLLEALDSSGEILLSHRAALLPGLDARLGAVRTVGEMAVFEGCGQYQPPADISAGLAFTTRLKSSSRAAALAPAKIEKAPVRPAMVTHVVAGGSLYAVSERPLHVNADGSLSAERRADTLASVAAGSAGASLVFHDGVRATVNGRPAAGGEMPLRPGDAVAFEGSPAALLCVSEVNLHGAA